MRPRQVRLNVNCHATIGPPKISSSGLVKAALYGPPGPLETLQLVPPPPPPDNLERHGWSPSATSGPPR